MVRCQDLDDGRISDELKKDFCQEGDGAFLGVDVASYCQCANSVYPATCGSKLCPGTMSDSFKMYEGLTCGEWDDMAKSVVDRAVCYSTIQRAIDHCCDQVIGTLGLAPQLVDVTQGGGFGV